MAATRKIINHIIPRKSSPPCTFRWLSPAKQPRTDKSFLVYKVKALVTMDSFSSITKTLNEYHIEGNTVEKLDIKFLRNHFLTQKNYQSALQLYDWVESRKLKLTNVDQAIRIELLCKTGYVSSAEKYFHSLKEYEKTNKTYEALLNCYCWERVVDKALEIFKMMKALNYTTILNYNNMISLYYSVEQPEKVISLGQELEETHNVYTYNKLMNSYAALKNLDAIEEIVEKMKSSNVKLDLFTYGNLATIFLNSGLHIKAKTYLEMMEKTEFRTKQEFSRSACTRIRLYSELNDLSGVNKTWESLKLSYPIPKNDCYRMMLLGLSKHGELEGLEKLYKEWEEHSSGNFDFRLPNVLLEYYLNHDLIEKASVLFESLVCRGNEPNLMTINLFATLCVKKGQIDLGLKYLEMGVNKFSNWFPTDEATKLFLNYFEKKNDVVRVEKFIQILKNVNRHNPVVYDSWLSIVKGASNIKSITEILNEYQNGGKTITRLDIKKLINYFLIRKNYQSALQLYDWVESRKIYLRNADEAIRIQLLSKTEDLSSAEKYFNNLPKSEKTNIAYGALLGCYCRVGAVDKALKIFEKMKKALDNITILNYNNMISLYYSIEQHKEVVSLVQEMEEKHTVGDLYTYNKLINSYAALKNVDALEKVLEKMQSNNLKLDLFTYGNLATKFLNFGSHIKAKTYLDMMEKTACRTKREFAQAACTRIRLYSQMIDLSGVNKAWKSLKSIYPTPNKQCYLMMLLGLSKLRELERLEKLYKEWEEQSCDDFDFRLPNVLLEYYLNQDLIDKATVLFESLFCRGNEPNFRAINSCAILCVKKGQIELGLKYLEMGVNKTRSLSYTFPTDEAIKLFLNYFEKKNDVGGVEKFILILKKINRHNPMVYNSWLSIVKGASNIGR